MLIQIDKLKRRPRQIDIKESATDFAVLNELMRQENVTFDETIHGRLTATWAGDVIKVSGKLSTSVSLACGRCLQPVSSPLDVDVLLCYGSKGADDAPDAEEIELSSDELGLIPIVSQEIDLRADLEQEIIMSLPQHLLCSESCAGLCPVCGINLNQNQCECEKPVLHAGLAALKNFKVEQ